MKIDIDYYTFNKMIKFINFENENLQEEADYFSLTGRYLWKRDNFRLISVALKDSIGANFNYDSQLLDELAYGEEIEIDSNGVIHYKDEDAKKMIHPVEAPLLPESLKVITAKRFDAEFKIRTDKLIRHLIEINKVYLNEGEETFTEIIFDLSHGKMIAKGKKTIEKDVPIDLRKIEKDIFLKFDYRMLRDLLINANDFTHELLFKTVHPYVTLIIYNKYLFAALMHKKE